MSGLSKGFKRGGLPNLAFKEKTGFWHFWRHWFCCRSRRGRLKVFCAISTEKGSIEQTATLSIKKSCNLLNKVESIPCDHYVNLGFFHSIPLCPINLIEWAFKREGSPYLACKERQTFFTSGDSQAFFTSGDTKRYKLWSCQKLKTCVKP